MDDEMIMLDKVMSVELAIKRELEYRTKMELLNVQHRTHLKPLVPLEGPPQSPVGLKRKEPACNSQMLASAGCEAFRKHPGGLICDACKMTFVTLFHLRQHCVSKRHHEKLLELKNSRVASSNPYSCGLCKISCSGAPVIELHLSGTKHALNLRAFENAKMARAGQAWLQTGN